jgi:hypothetical protein
MTERATFSLEEENFAFLARVGGKNKSAYINDLLRREKKKILAECILQANKEEAEDLDYQEELSAWDETLSDGLNG